MKSFLHYIQYHNSALLVIVLILGVGGTAFAANEVLQHTSDAMSDTSTARENGTGTSTTTRASSTHAAVDVQALLALDLERFSMDAEITAVEEGDSDYIITYQYQTYALQDRVWQEVTKEMQLTVAKAQLRDRNLESYAYEQISQVLEKERAYLARVQDIEIQRYEHRTRNASLEGLSLDALASRTKEEREIPDIPEVSETAEEEEQFTQEQQGAVLGAHATSSATTTHATSSTQTHNSTSTRATSSDNGTGTAATGTTTPPQSSGASDTQMQSEDEHSNDDGSVTEEDDTTQDDSDESAGQQSQDEDDESDSSENENDDTSQESDDTQDPVTDDTHTQQQTDDADPGTGTDDVDGQDTTPSESRA